MKRSNWLITIFSTFGILGITTVFTFLQNIKDCFVAEPLLSMWILTTVFSCLLILAMIYICSQCRYYEIAIENINADIGEVNIDTINVNADPNRFLTSIAGVVTVHDTLQTPELMRNASNHILLHAAFYPRYGVDVNYSSALREAVMKNRYLKIKVVVTDIAAKWALEFGKILRYEFTTTDEFEQGIRSSLRFFYALKKEFPENVEIVSSKALPLSPIVIIDNHILVGHYAHAQVNAPNGFWMHIMHDKVTDFYRKVSLGEQYQPELTPEEKAITRYIEDFHYAFTHSKVCQE